MNRRDLLRAAAPFLLTSSWRRLEAGPCVSSLDPRTSAEYDAYLKAAGAKAEQPFRAGILDRLRPADRGAAMKTLESGQPYIWNLNEDQPHGVTSVYKGVVVDWMGAVRIPGLSLEKFEHALSQYDFYKQWYKPYIYDCYARPVEGPGFKNFRVTSILHDVLEKPGPLVPDQHFSFEVVAESSFFHFGEESSPTLVIRTHATSIREAGSGRPDHADSRMYNDLLPPQQGQGVLWRSDTWWRAREMNSGVYAEYESLSLARSVDAIDIFSPCSVLRLPGLKGKAFESMIVRPRKTVTAVVLQTRAACESVA